MTNLFSRTFHCLWFPSTILPPKSPSQSLPFSSSIHLPKRFIFTSTSHTHVPPCSASSSTSSPQEHEPVELISSTQLSDGSIVFTFGNASEIREMIDELNGQKLVPEGVIEEGGVGVLLSDDGVEKLRNEDDGNLGEEIESSSTVVVAVADQNPQLLVSEDESSVVPESEIPVINDLQKIDKNLMLDTVEEDSRVDSLEDVGISTVSPAELDVISDLSSDASLEVEEKEVYNGGSVDRAANSPTGCSDASDLTELVQLSTSIKSDHSVNGTTSNLTDSVDAEIRELETVSTSLESAQDDYSATDNLSGRVDAKTSKLVPVSASSESAQDDYSATDNLTDSVDTETNELVPVSTSSESAQDDYSATDNLTVNVDTETNELVPVSTSSESEQIGYSAADILSGTISADISELEPVSTSLESAQDDYSATTDNLTGSVDVETSELVPVSTSSESEQVGYSAADILTGSIGADISELESVSTSLDSEQSVDSETTRLTDSVVAEFSESVPISTSLEAEQVDNSATDKLTASVDTEVSELVPLSTSLEPEQVDYSAIDNLTDDVDDGIIHELAPVPNSSDSDQPVIRETTHLTDGVDAEFSESVPLFTSLEAEQVEYSETNNLTSGVDTELNALVPISTSLEPEQLDYSATDQLIGGLDTDLTESTLVSTSSGFELHANDGETSLRIVDDSVDASEMEKSALLDELVPSSDLENKIDVGNTERNDYENPLFNTLPEIHSVEIPSDGFDAFSWSFMLVNCMCTGKITRTELFLVSGAACLPHPSEALTNREDAYIISPQNWLVVADGVGQWSLEGSNTRVYIRELMEKCENIVSNYENISTIKPADVLIRSAAETQSPGSSSVLVAYFDGQALHATNVGNTGFIIIRDGSVFKISNAMLHELGFPIHLVKGDDHSEVIEEYKIDLNNGDVIVFGTNGLFDNLYEHEIASTISKSLQASLEPQEIAEILATAAQEVGRSRSNGSPFADAAQALGYVSYAGGKLDDVTVIVSLVQTT